LKSNLNYFDSNLLAKHILEPLNFDEVHLDTVQFVISVRHSLTESAILRLQLGPLRLG
jgi:hypothetical protein